MPSDPGEHRSLNVDSCRQHSAKRLPLFFFYPNALLL